MSADQEDGERVLRIAERLRRERLRSARNRCRDQSDMQLVVPKTPTATDLRNAALEHTMKELEVIERRFAEDDPVREALTAARRTAAKHLIVPSGVAKGLKVIK